MGNLQRKQENVIKKEKAQYYFYINTEMYSIKLCYVGFFSMSQFYDMELNLGLEKNLNKNNKQHKKYL